MAAGDSIHRMRPKSRIVADSSTAGGGTVMPGASAALHPVHGACGHASGAVVRERTALGESATAPGSGARRSRRARTLSHRELRRLERSERAREGHGTPQPIQPSSQSARHDVPRDPAGVLEHHDQEHRDHVHATDGLVVIDSPLEGGRPQTRADCRDGPRPCLFVSCRFHLYLDVNERTGSIKLNFPELEPWELVDSCALDTAERGGMTLEQIGQLLNVTRERARQMEQSGLKKLRVLGVL